MITFYFNFASDLKWKYKISGFEMSFILQRFCQWANLLAISECQKEMFAISLLAKKLSSGTLMDLHIIQLFLVLLWNIPSHQYSLT